MRRRHPALALLLIVMACSESATLPFAVPDPSSASWVNRQVLVTSTADAGPGTLRAALEAASADTTIGRILFAPEVGWIYPLSTLTFSGPQPLVIDGNMQPIFGSAAYGDVFRMTVRSSITFTRILVGFGSGNGVTILVPEGTTGTVKVNVTQAAFLGNRRHGLLINDQPDYLVNENSTSTAGSPASIRLTVAGADFQENGNDHLYGWGAPYVATPDADGLRINEGGDGNVVVVSSALTAFRNGDDGIEIDERGNGNIDLKLSGSQIAGNGYSSLEVEKGDGVRLEESGAGALTVATNDVSVESNVEQAFDLSESGAGKLTATLVQTNITWHFADAVRIIEDDAAQGGGDLVLTVTDMLMTDNGLGFSGDTAVLRSANLVVHEKGSGTVNARLTRADIGPGQFGEYGGTYGGLSIREEAAGSLLATIEESGFYGHHSFGILLDERGRDNLVVQLNGGIVDNNGVVGIRADQEPLGYGTLTLNGVSVQGNAGGANNVQVVPGQVSVVITP